MRTDLFHYELPPELIAQSPAPRGESRLLVLRRSSGEIEHRQFADFSDYLEAGDTLVVNNTRVTARRIEAVRSGAPAEVLLLAPVGLAGWEALVRPGRSFRPGRRIVLRDPHTGATADASVACITRSGGRILEMDTAEQRDRMGTWGDVPLPPYIRGTITPEVEERYGTVYAAAPGSAAAPTAGLHFTSEMLDEVRRRSVNIAEVTLSVGIDTFRPVKEEHVTEHVMHGERIVLPAETARIVNETTGRVVAVGTTTVRTLESAAREAGPGARVAPVDCETTLFLTPGCRFQAVDALVTNFHLPKSTLLMLVSAFAGIEAIREAYRQAVELRYRFFSFGDAMLIL